MRRAARMASLVTVLVAFGGVASTAHAGLLGKRKAPSAARGPVGLFASGCKLSHRLPDDPIVTPGAPGASHMHEFFGNESTNARSTSQTMLAAGETSCTRADDLSGYWVPTLYTGFQAVRPRLTAYYLAGPRNTAFIRSFPAGLKMIAGNSSAPKRQNTRIVSWSCGPSRGRQNRDAPPLCPKRTLMLIVRFPDCWDGVNLDSFDHKAHMTYSRRLADGSRGCTSTHPVAVPALELHLRYRSRGGPLVRVASGPARTVHADFFNTWRQSALDALVQRCLNANVDCREK